MAATTLNVMSQHIRNPLNIFYHRRIIYMKNSPVPASPSHMFIKDPFAWIFTTISTYFYVLRQYSTYSQRRESIEYPNQDSIYLYAKFHRENLKQNSLNSFPPRVSCYVYTLLILYCKFKITTLSGIALEDKLITFNLII